MKPLFNYAALGATLILASTGTASASDIFNFAADAGSTSSTYGNSLTFTESVGTMTVTATAWYLPAGFTSSTTFGAAAMDNYNGTNLGLGICSPNDPSGAGCSSPYHQIDNSNGVEFVSFHFSQAVNLSGATVQITNYAPIGSTSSVDLTYYTASTGLTASTTYGSLGSGTTINQNCPGTTCQGTPFSDVLSATGTNSYLVVAAAVSPANGVTDAFKLNSLTVNATTPEPATWGTVTLTLFLLGCAEWRRRFVSATRSS